MEERQDLISRRDAIDALHTWFRDGFDEDKWWNSTHVLAAIEGLPSAQQGYKWETCFECPLSHGCPKIKGCTNEQAIEYASQIPNDCPLSTQPEPSEITDEQAILHLQSTGWMQNHDREIYESGLKEQLADDSESYDSLIPYEDDGDTISRQAAVDVVDFECGEWRGLAKTIINKLEALPAVQPERVCVATATLTDEQVKEAVEKAKNTVISVIEPEPHWIPCSERLPKKTGYYLTTNEYKVVHEDYYWGSGCFEKAKKISVRSCGMDANADSALLRG